jgi:hypothetical protein
MLRRPKLESGYISKLKSPSSSGIFSPSANPTFLPVVSFLDMCVEQDL